MNRYDLARLGSTFTAAVLTVTLLTPAAMAGSHCCAAKRSAVAAAPAACVAPSATVASLPSTPATRSVTPATATAAPVWLPSWVGPAAPAAIDVPDYAALFAPSLPALAPGMVVAIDPETGMPMKPSAAQRRALTMDLEGADALLPPDAPMVTESLPGGGVAVTLNGHFQMYSIARIGPDGRVVTDCAHDAATAKRMLVTPAPRVAPAATKE